MELFLNIVLSVLGLLVGGAIVFFVFSRKKKAELDEKKGKADDIIEKAKKNAQEIKYRARKEAKDITKEEMSKVEAEVMKEVVDL